MAEKVPGPYDELLELTCAQVPSAFEVGSEVLLWLGSDNNKGQPTDWDQGVRALGRCETKTGVKTYKIEIRILYFLPRSVEKSEFLQFAPFTYADSLADTPIVGLNNYSSQVVQSLTDEQFFTLIALMARILPEVGEDILGLFEGASLISVMERGTEQPTIIEPPKEPLTTTMPDNNPAYMEVLSYINDDEVGGVLLTGSPGTGKSWHAMQIAIKLTNGDASRIRRVQFHPSYQYEDFVEGYVPKGGGRFTLAKKHLLLAADKARKTDGLVVIIIDEFSRTDPSRVLGECLTYMEGSLRDQDFLLPSGNTARIPKNLIFLATMNPEDRSVDEIDAAMERRWSKVELRPSTEQVVQFLQGNGAPNPIIPPIVKFFNKIQAHTPIGHAFFRTVKDLPSLQRLWDGQLRHLFAKRYRYDKGGKTAVEAEWDACRLAVQNSVSEEPANVIQAVGNA